MRRHANFDDRDRDRDLSNPRSLPRENRDFRDRPRDGWHHNSPLERDSQYQREPKRFAHGDEHPQYRRGGPANDRWEHNADFQRREETYLNERDRGRDSYASRDRREEDLPPNRSRGRGMPVDGRDRGRDGPVDNRERGRGGDVRQPERNRREMDFDGDRNRERGLYMDREDRNRGRGDRGREGHFERDREDRNRGRGDRGREGHFERDREDRNRGDRRDRGRDEQTDRYNARTQRSPSLERWGHQRGGRNGRMERSGSREGWRSEHDNRMLADRETGERFRNDDRNQRREEEKWREDIQKGKPQRTDRFPPSPTEPRGSPHPPASQTDNFLKRSNPREPQERPTEARPPTTAPSSNNHGSARDRLSDLYDPAYRPPGQALPIWNFEIEPTNIQYKNSPLPREPPLPEVEYERAQIIAKLRLSFKDLCLSKLKKEAPRASFNRWLFAQLTATERKDAFLPDPEKATATPVLKSEIQNGLPAPAYVPWSVRKNADQIIRAMNNYLTAAQRYIKFSMDFPNKKDILETIKNRVEEAKAKHASDPQELLKGIKNLHSEVWTLMEPTLQPKIDELMQELASQAHQSINLLEDIYQEQKKRDHTRSGVSLLRTNQGYLIKYKTDALFLTELHLKKLRTLYVMNTPEDSACGLFLERLYILLRRYQTFFGPDESGGTMHAASPENVFNALNVKLGVQQENFASPLNCFFKRFNSAFPDTDVYFGSLGSFFNFEPTTGSFETGPPYTEEIITAMAEHLEHLLSSSSEPLSFVVFVPDWRDPLTPGLHMMEQSRYLVTDFVLEGNKSYVYVVGKQHEEKERYFSLPIDTHLYFMQNEAGRVKFPLEIDGNVAELERECYKQREHPTNT
eukprot:TRINITY_DN12702_c0_g1_i3.p1 TRINITY_DN12702_c0_g1~~TRINITY_DN12702_c0_g1_i3.p1  ORF type:complete len:860 (+),score=194.93 TRINITY_DN12702_c0_g1_i3:17-2596(+)